jgi:hypothetical protein
MKEGRRIHLSKVFNGSHEIRCDLRKPLTSHGMDSFEEKTPPLSFGLQEGLFKCPWPGNIGHPFSVLGCSDLSFGSNDCPANRSETNIDFNLSSALGGIVILFPTVARV